MNICTFLPLPAEASHRWTFLFIDIDSYIIVLAVFLVE